MAKDAALYVRLLALFKKSPLAIRYVPSHANNGRYRRGLQYKRSSEIESLRWGKCGIRVPPPSALEPLFDTRWSDETSISGIPVLFQRVIH